jgi:predicted acyltransferase
LIGYFTCDWLRKQPVGIGTVRTLLRIGLAMAAVGSIWGAVFPINKKLWTSSFTVLMGGLAALVLAGCYWLIEVARRRRWSEPFKAFGMNSIAIYVASIIGIKLLFRTHIGTAKTYDWVNGRLFESWAGPYNGPALLAALTVVLWWAVAHVMSERKWFLKV